MQPTSLIDALHTAADFYGKCVKNDRQYLMRQIHKLRTAAWEEENAREAYFKRSGCECVECITETCGTRCRPNYSAITLDVNMVGIHVLTHNEQPIDLATDPLGNAGCCGSCACKKYELMVERFPLKRALPRGYKNKLILKNTDSSDNGKIAGIKYVNPDGKILRADLKLDSQGVGTEWNVGKVLELTLPRRCGWINAMTVDGYNLGSFHPSVLAPMHRRVKLAGVAAGETVHWEGYLEPIRAVFDTDFIEFGGELHLENGLQWLDLHFRKRDPSEERAYQACFAMFKGTGASELAAQATVPVATLRPKVTRQLRRGIKWIMGGTR